MANRNQVTTNLKISANAQLGNSRNFINQLDKIIDKFDFGDRINNQLISAKNQLKDYNKILERVQDKKIVSNEELKELTRAGKEIANIITRTERLYSAFDTKQLEKFSKEYIAKVQAQEKEIAKIKEDYAKKTGSNFDKDLQNLNEYQNRIDSLNKSVQQLNNTQDSKINEKIAEQNRYLQNQYETLEKIKQAEKEINAEREGIVAQYSKQSGFSINDLQSKMKTDRKSVTKDVSNQEYQKMFNTFQQIDRKREEIVESEKDEKTIEKELVKLAAEYNLKNVKNTQEFNKQLSILERQKNHYRLLTNREQLATEKLITKEIERRNRIKEQQLKIDKEVAVSEKTILRPYGFNSPQDMSSQKRKAVNTLNTTNVQIDNSGARLTDSGEDNISNEIISATKEQTTKLTAELDELEKIMSGVRETNSKLATQSERAADEGDIKDMSHAVDEEIKDSKKTINAYTNTDNTRIAQLIMKKQELDNVRDSGLNVINEAINSLTGEDFDDDEIIQANKKLFANNFDILSNSIDKAISGKGNLEGITNNVSLFNNALDELINELYKELSAREQIRDQEIRNIENSNLSNKEKDKLKTKEYGTFSIEQMRFKNIQDKLLNIKDKSSSIFDVTRLEKNSKGLQQFTKPVNDTADAIARASEESQYLGSVWDDFKNKTAYFLSLNYVFDTMVRQIRTAVTTTQELDKDMAQIGLVLQQTSSLTWKNFDSYAKKADRLSTTTTDVTAAMKLFYQQGLNTAQVNKMVEASAIAAALGESTMAEASETLTSIVNSYQLAANEAIDVTDKISQVAIVSAADFGEISTAIEKVASSAASAGLDLDHLMGYLGKIIETTREAPTNVGTALKTIVANFTQFKEDPSFVTDEGTSVNDVDEALKTVGIELKDTQGQIRDLGEVLDELGGKWSDLGRNQRAYLATTIAGNRQQSRFYALMNGYDRTLELVNESENSSGKAKKQFALYQDSLTASTQRLKNETEKFYHSLTAGDGILKNIYNTLTGLLGVVNDIGPIWTTIFGVTGIKQLRKMFSSISQSKDLMQSTLGNMLNTQNLSGVIEGSQNGKISNNLKNFLSFGGSNKATKKANNTIGGFAFSKLVQDEDLKKINEYNQLLNKIDAETLPELNTNYEKLSQTEKDYINTVASSVDLKQIDTTLTNENAGAQAKTILMKGRDTTVTKVNTAAKWANVAAQAAMTIGITAAIAGISALANWLSDLNKKNREAAASAEDAYNNINTETSELEDSIKTYTNLKSKIALTSEEKEELAEINSKIADEYPQLIASYDSEGNAILKNTQYLKEYLKTKKQESQEKAKEKAETAVKATETFGKGLLEWNGKFKNEDDLLSDNAKSSYEKVQSLYDELKKKVNRNSNGVGLDALDMLMQPNATQDTLDIASSFVNDEDKDKVKQLYETVKRVNEQNIQAIQDTYQDYYNETISLLTYEQNNLDSEQQGFVEGLAKTFANTTISDNITQITDKLNKGEINSEEAQKQINEYLKGQGTELVTSITNALSKVAKSSNFDKVKEIYDEYTTAQTEGYSFITQEEISQRLIEQINKTPGLSEEQKQSITSSIQTQQQERNKDLEDIIKQAMGAAGTEGDSSSDVYKKYENVFKNLSSESQQKLSEEIEDFMAGENDDFTYSNQARKKMLEKIIPSISDLIDNELIGQKFSEELQNLDFENSIEVENFKADWGYTLVEKLKSSGISEQMAIDIVNGIIPDPGVVAKDVQKKMSDLKTAFTEINEVSIEDLLGGEMDITDAAEADVLDLGFTVGDKFIASTEVVTDKLGEANSKMLGYIELLKRSATQDVEKAQQAIQEAQETINNIQINAQGRNLTQEEQSQVQQQQKQITSQRELIENANRRLKNAEKLTQEYKNQAKELSYINQYSEVQNAAESVNTLVDSITDLADAWDKANEGSLSQLDIIKMIADSNGDYLKFLEVENNQLKLSTKSMEQYAEAKAEEVKNSIQLDINKLESLYELIDADKFYTKEEMDNLTARASAQVEAAKGNQETKQNEAKDNEQLENSYKDTAIGVVKSMGDIVNGSAQAAQDTDKVKKSIWQSFTDFFKNLGNKISKFAGAVWDWFKSGFKEWNYDDGDHSDADMVAGAIGNKLKDLIKNTPQYVEKMKQEQLQGEQNENPSEANWGKYTTEDYSKGVKGSEWKTQIQDKIAKLKAIQGAINVSGKDLLKNINEMGSDKDDDYEASVEHLEHFYNYLRKIESLEAKIQKIRTKRSTLDLTTNYNTEALKQENDLLKEQAKLYGQYIGEEVDYLATLRDQLKSTYGDWVYFTNEGVVQVTQTDFAINSEDEEKRFNAFNELLEEYQSQYQTYLENQNTLLETQQTIIENIKEMYDKILQQLDDITAHLEHLQSISEHQADMSVGNLDKLSAYNNELAVTIDLYTHFSKTLGDIKKDMNDLNGLINAKGVGQYVDWNSGTNQYQTSDYFDQQVLNGGIDSNTVTLVESIVAASQKLNEEWRDVNSKVMSTESTLRQIAEQRLSAITDLIGSWKDQLTDIFDIVNRQLSLKDTIFDLTGYNSGDLEEKYKNLAEAAVLTKKSWGEMQQVTNTALEDLKREYGEYIQYINGVPFINKAGLKESTKLTDEQKLKAEELITTYEQLKEATDDLEDSTYEFLQTMKEMKEKQIDDTIDILQQLHDEMKAIDEEQVADLQKKYDEMSRLDNEYYSKLQQKIQDTRDARENNQAQIQTDQLRAQIAVMQKDNTSQYNQQLINLQKQLNEQLQAQADAEIDRELERIEREQQERQEDRDLQIQQMENLITFKDENRMYWQLANQYLDMGYNQVAGFLATREQNKDQSDLAIQEVIGETKEVLSNVYADLGAYNARQGQTTENIQNIMSNFISADYRTSVDNLLNKLGITDANIRGSLTTNLNAVSNTINSGIGSTLSTLRAGYQEFWNQFSGVNGNIKTLQTGVYNTGTGIIQQIGNTGSQAVYDAGLIRGLQNAEIGATNNAANQAGNAAGAADNAAGQAGRAANNIDNMNANMNSALQMANGWLRNIYTELIYIKKNTDSLPWIKAYQNYQEHGPLYWLDQNIDSIKRKIVNEGFDTWTNEIEFGGSWLNGLGLNLGGTWGHIYKKGGYVDYTGPAWVDGTKNSPEAFLNSRQTALFENLKDNLEKNKNIKNSNNETSYEETLQIDNLNINVQEVADTNSIDKIIGNVKESIYKDATGRNNMKIRRR